MTKIILLLTTLFLLSTPVAFTQVILNEIQYGNKTTLFDNNGDTPDWIELYNSSNKAVNLLNYKLSQSSNPEEAWVFPQISIDPQAYLLVYASGKNRKEKNDLHVDFKLSILKDSLFFFNASNEIIDAVFPECVPTDRALGYVKGIVNRKIISPTPGKQNADTVNITVNYIKDTLLVDKTSGKYNESVAIVFSKNKPSNQIFYTINGNEPDEESIPYTEPLLLRDISTNKNRFAKKVEEFEPGDLIAKANIIRARVFSEGCPASNEISNTYFVGGKTSFKYNVPMISIITDKDNLFDDEIGIYVEGNHNNLLQKGSAWEREAHLEYFDTAGNQVIDQDAGIRIHGRTSRWLAQKSFRLYAKDKYGKETFDYPFFKQKSELNSFKTLLLKTTVSDWSQTLFTDELCHNIVDPMNIDYMAGQTNIVYINGEYWGIYSLRERQDEDYITNNHHIENPDLDVISFDHGVDVKSGSIDNYQELLDWLTNNSPESNSFYDEVSKRIDLDNLSDYFIAELFLAHFDFPDLNIDMWRNIEDTAKWRYFFFDLDGAMIKINYDHLSNYNNTIEDLQRYEEDEEFILSRLLENKTFRNNFNMKYLHHIETTFNSSRILDLIDTYEEQYTPLIAEQAYRWGKPIDVHKWSYNVSKLRYFALQRPSVVMDQLIKNFENPFSIFPNPNNGNFTIAIENPMSNESRYSVYNAQGTPIINNRIFDNNGTIAHINLESGIYMIRIKYNGFYFREKIIVE